jgi:hypothetical protein
MNLHVLVTRIPARNGWSPISETWWAIPPCLMPVSRAVSSLKDAVDSLPGTNEDNRHQESPHSLVHADRRGYRGLPHCSRGTFRCGDGSCLWLGQAVPAVRSAHGNAYTQARVVLEVGGLQFGWRSWPDGTELVSKIIGLLISIFAVSLGAPFWFDVLQRFMQVRQAGVTPQEKEDKKK